MPADSPPNSRLTWDSINDFRPGIYSQSQFAIAGTPLPSSKGFAQPTNTYRCIALPNGGLAPLPKSQPAASNAPVDHNPATPWHIVGFHAVGPVIGTGALSTFRDELHVMMEYVVGANRRMDWFRQRLFDAGGGVLNDLLHSETTAGVAGVYYGTSFAESRMSPNAPYSDVGVPVVGTTWRDIDSGDQFVWSFPDPSTPALNAIFSLSTADSGLIVAHEGRLVLATFVSVQSHGVNCNMSFNEAINYSDPSNSNVWTDPMTVYAPENPAGYGIAASVNTSELLLIKHKGGAVLISGDLDSVTVTRLPFVQSTGNLISIPAVSPSGLFYLTKNQGLWNWNGGNGSSKVSQNLDDNFYDLSPPFVNVQACTEVWGDWILISNNWLMDLATGNFWRLEDPSVTPFFWFSRSFNSDGLFAAPVQIGPAGGDPTAQTFAWYFKRGTNVTNYSWQSHPLSWSINRRVRVREVVVRAVGPGAGTVTLTFSGQTQDTNDQASVVIDIPAGTSPQKVRAAANFSGEDIAVRIVSDGGMAEAPTVFEVQFGYEETTYLNAA